MKTCHLRESLLAVCIAACAVAGAVPALATENSQSHIDLAFFDTLAGYTLPPGLYVRDDVNVNISSRLNDQNGNPVKVNAGLLGKYPLKFYSGNAADVLSVVYVPGITIPYLNATIGTGAYGAYAWSRAEAQDTIFGQTTGSGETRRGLGDVTFVPLFLQWAIPKKDLYFLLSPVEFAAPVGEYHRNDPIGNNIGLNYWTYHPALLFTYLNKFGQEFSINTSLAFNSQNNATKYKSGDEFAFTYVLEQHVSRKLAFGAEGYFYDQITDDTQNGVVVNTVRPTNPEIPFDPLNEGPGDRGQVFGIGPTLNWFPTPALATNFHWVHEVFSYNRKQGEVFWIRALYHF